MVTNAHEVLILVLECQPSAKVRHEVERKVAAGQCVGQRKDGSDCTEKPRCRGLCHHCENAWRVTRGRMGKKDAAAYDARLIKTGRLLSPLQARQYKDKSAYRRLA